MTSRAIAVKTNLTTDEVKELRALIGSANDFRWDEAKVARIVELMRKDFSMFTHHYLFIYDASWWVHTLETGDGYVEVDPETLLGMVEDEHIRLYGGPVSAISKRTGRFVDISFIDKDENGDIYIEISYSVGPHDRDLGATEREITVGAEAYRFILPKSEEWRVPRKVSQ